MSAPTALLACLSLLASPTDEARPLPTPPQQARPWTAPETDLPEVVESAAAKLYTQGLADPRGCDYREVTLGLEKDRPPYPPDRPRTHAWVLPAEGADAPRFAVAWNGLVYPLADVGEPADLDADVRALVARCEQARADAARLGQPVYLPFGDPYQAAAEAAVVHQSDLNPIKVIHLLRLGRGDLAAAHWDAARGDEGLFREGRDPYPMLAVDWAWQLLNRAADAHARGDDALALATARDLHRLRGAIEETIADRRRRYPQIEDNRLADPLRFLAPLPALLGDQDRRVRPGPRTPPAAEADPKSFATPADRIDALIRDLQEIHAEPMMMPGFASLSGAAAMRALVAEGDRAVPALLDCLRFDTRLTRTIDRDNRHGSRYLSVRPVHDAARQALVEILGTQEFGLDAYSADRRALADKIEAYWKANRGLTPPERLYRTLADDRATVEQWLDASNRITRPSDVRGTRNAFSYTRPDGVAPPPFGEPLRDHAEPGVTALLARRIRQVDPGGRVSGNLQPITQGNLLTDDLARWDPKGAVPALRERFARNAAVAVVEEVNGGHSAALAHAAQRYTMLRVAAGDADAALDDYAAWIVRLPATGWFEPLHPTVFQPLWRHTDHPAIADAARRLFADASSPWVPLFRPGDRGWAEWQQLVASPLIGVAPFRKLVLDGLADDRDSGSVVAVKPADQPSDYPIEIRRADGSTFWKPLPGDPALESGTTTPLHLQDIVAWAVTNLPGAPRFELIWPEPDRDRAIAALRDYLTRYAANFEAARDDGPPALEPWPYRDFQGARLRFKPLGRPATPDDVDAGRAIFALDGDARVVPQPETPLVAEWTTYDGAPRWGQVGNGTGVVHDRLGQVWQSEEIDENGHARRYYGFVGPHVIGRAPAEEILFPADWQSGFSPVSDDLEAKFEPPDFTRAGPDAPRLATLSLRNRRGIEIDAPDGVAGRAGLRDDVTIRLLHVPKPSEGQSYPDLSRDDAWTELPMKPTPAGPGAGSVPLEPAQSRDVLVLDLDRLFDLSRPGLYRLDARLETIPPPPDGRFGHISAQFGVP